MQVPCPAAMRPMKKWRYLQILVLREFKLERVRDLPFKQAIRFATVF